MDQVSDISSFEYNRLEYKPALPEVLQDSRFLQCGDENFVTQSEMALQETFPHLSKVPKVRLQLSKDNPPPSKPLKVGVLFSGGQAPGGHNVVIGLFNALKKFHKDSALYGFLDGPSGLIDGRSKLLDDDLLSNYRNLGGFDLLGSSRTKFEAPTQAAILKHVNQLDLDGLVIIGGDDSNTNAAFLAEYFLLHACKTCVVGVPKTIDGDLKSSDIEISFGFDTATKTYSQIIGNLARDLISAKKYYYFVKLMGRSASSVALECALQTHPNYTLIGEEIAAKKMSLSDVVQAVADIICERAKLGKNYGLILVPEGLLEFIFDCKLLIKELGFLDNALSKKSVREKLTVEARHCFDLFPMDIQDQLFLDRDPHGNLQVSKIETERLLITLITAELARRASQGKYYGQFAPQPLFCGYEGRSCAPSNFDANYCYALGHTAAGLIQNQRTGYIAAVKGLAQSVENWQPYGIPLVSLMTLEERKGISRMVIRKTLVDPEGLPFKCFKEKRVQWAYEDDFRYPGPIQYFGPKELTDQITETLALETMSHDFCRK